MPFIGLQAGHQNIQENTEPLLRPETGAQGEEPLNVAVRDALSLILQKYGFQVQLDDANANSSPNTIGKDFDFYLALHAEGAPPGGNVVAPDPSVDASSSESHRIVNAIADAYFKDSGIPRNTLVTNNETYYYMWNVLTAKTPCGIIEMGDLQDAHDKVILSDTRRVALGIAHGLCSAFGIVWKGDPDNQPIPGPLTPPTPGDPCVLEKIKLATLQKEFDDYKASHPTITTVPVSANANPGVSASTPPVQVPSVPSVTQVPSDQANQAVKTANYNFFTWIASLFK